MAIKKPVTPVKTVEAKVDPAKAEVKKTEVKSAQPAKKEEAVKPEAKKEEVKKEEPKKVAAKKPAKKTMSKKDIPSTVYVQYAGKQVAVDDVLPSVRKVWQKAGNRIRDIKDIKLYIKPEDNKIYFVINDDFNGSIDFE